MKIRGLIFATLVLLVLCGVFYWSEYRKPAADAAKPLADAPPAILKIDQSAITRLDIKRRDAETVSIEKAASGNWQITQPNPLAADQNEVLALLNAVSSLNSERVVEEKAADLKPFGLDPPAVEVSITGKDNKTRKLLIGDNAPVGSAVYAMLAGSPRVYTMAFYLKTRLDKGLNDLRDRRLFDFSFSGPDKIELRSGPKWYLFTRTGADWWSGGKKMDAAGVQALVGKLRDLSASKFVDSGFTTATIAATVTSDGGKRVEKVMLSKSGDGYVAKRENELTLYQLDANAVDDLQKAADGITPAAVPTPTK